MTGNGTAGRQLPLLVVGFVLMLTLKEHPLATKVNHTGHPGDTV